MVLLVNVYVNVYAFNLKRVPEALYSVSLIMMCHAGGKLLYY